MIKDDEKAFLMPPTGEYTGQLIDTLFRRKGGLFVYFETDNGEKIKFFIPPYMSRNIFFFSHTRNGIRLSIEIDKVLKNYKRI